MVSHGWSFTSIAVVRIIHLLFLHLFIIPILPWSPLHSQQFLFNNCTHAPFLLTCALYSRIMTYHYVLSLFRRVHSAQSGCFCSCFFFFYFFQEVFGRIYVSGDILVYVFDHLKFSFWCCFLTSVLKTIDLVWSWELGFCISSWEACGGIAVVH